MSEDKLAGYIAMADEIREESYEAVRILKKNGLKIYMMTGDNEKVARSVSDELELDGYFAGILPDQKLEKIKEFQDHGEYVAMTGDGINDAPALAAADVGIAVGSGTDIAAETADIILVHSNPQDIASLVVFGKETYKKMTQNFAWATGYNIFAIPLAAGVLYPAGILISPALGAILMSLSTMVVAANAQLLKRKMKANH
jgi:Cu2+-exporting ATPase